MPGCCSSLSTRRPKEIPEHNTRGTFIFTLRTNASRRGSPQRTRTANPGSTRLSVIKIVDFMYRSLSSSYCAVATVTLLLSSLFLCISNLFFSYPVEKNKEKFAKLFCFCFFHTLDLSVWYHYQRPCSVQTCRVARWWWRCCAPLSACSCTGCAARIMCYNSRESSVLCCDNTQSVHMWDRWGPVWPWLIKVCCFLKPLRFGSLLRSDPRH